MKKLLFFSLSLFFTIQAFSQQLDIQFTTTQITNAEYNPKHILAVWVVNSSDVYQKSLMVYAQERKRYLEKWNTQTGGNTTDAITGATLSTHGTRNISWNLKNILGSTVPDGTYKLCMEITSSDFAGPYREIEFTIGATDFSLTPADGSNFTNISVNYTAPETATAIDDIQTENKLMNIYPNPANAGEVNVSLNLLKNSSTKISVISLDGKVLNTKSYDLVNGSNTVSLAGQTSDLKNGQYIIQVETDHYKIAKPLIIQ